MHNLKVTTVTTASLQLREYPKLPPPNDTAKETLVIFFSWLGASEKAISKYFELYHSLGYDILHVPGNVKHFAWPPTSVSLARTVLDYVCTELSHYRFLLIHSTSIGSYNYTSCLMEMNRNPVKYWNFNLRLVGNVFDSITYGSYERMRIGVSYGLTKSSFIRVLLQQLFALYFIVTKSTTVDFYKEGMKTFNENQAEVPSIFFYCKNDPLCDHSLIDDMVSDWRMRMSPPVLSVCWDSSVHAGHLFKQKDEYLTYHKSFMEAVRNFQTEKRTKTQKFHNKAKL